MKHQSLLYYWVGSTAALPHIAFPFNSQVPSVARVSQPYSFQFAAATFEPEGVNLTYSLTNGPTWLEFDATTRTLSGTPSSKDQGPSTFIIAAGQESGSVDMYCTLVVVDSPGPQLHDDISEQLSNFGALSGPSMMSLHPGNSFSISFRKNTFSYDGQTNLSYYSTLSDHTPLPAWIEFDASSLSFFGIAPSLSVESQTFMVELIASDIAGFAGAAAPFSLVVADHQLAFTPQQEILNVTAGQIFRYSGLRSQLKLDGGQALDVTLLPASPALPSWLAIDNETLVLSGVSPGNFQAQGLNISVQSSNGDIAVKTLQLRENGFALLDGKIGDLSVTAGKPFRYTIPADVFAQPGLSVQVLPQNPTPWLHFNREGLLLYGTPPLSVSHSVIPASLTVSSSEVAMSESQTFAISITAATSTTTSATRTASAGMIGPTSGELGRANGIGHGINAGAVVGIVIGCIAVLALLAILAMFLCRCTRRDPARAPSKGDISHPVVTKANREQIEDEERGTSGRMVDPQIEPVHNPPQIVLDLAPNSGSGSQVPNRRSAVSSLGDSEAMILADDAMPALGPQSATGHTPHDSYSAATHLAWVSQRGRESQKQRASWILSSNRLSPRKEMLDHGAGHFRGSTLLTEKKKLTGRKSGLSSIRGVKSTTSLGSCSTGVMTPRALSTTVPMKHPKRSSRTISQLPASEARDRKSIRLVNRSDSLTDNRPFIEKRQSFIRNRASSSTPSPLFTTASRASTHINTGGLERFTSHRVSQSSIVGRHARSKSKGTTYSASSSLEPHSRHSRRLESAMELSFGTNFPRPAGAQSSIEQEQLKSKDSGSSLYTDTSSSITEDDLRIELARPRHQRNWVLPGEASPTPPPLTPVSHYNIKSIGMSAESREVARRKWAHRLNRNSHGSLISASASPFANTVAITSRTPRTPSANKKAGQVQEDRGSGRPMRREPLGLISNDSLSASNQRPKSVHSKVRRLLGEDEDGRVHGLQVKNAGDRDAGLDDAMGEVEGSGMIGDTSRHGIGNGTFGSTTSSMAFI